MFGVSNLSWNNDEKAKIILDKYNIKYIEIAPTKICPWDELTVQKLKDYEKMMDKKIISIQSVLYNTGLSVTKKEDCDKILEHFKKVIEICSEVNIPKIVFGSPKARLVNNDEDKKIFIDNFKKINDICKENNVYVCLEHNSKKYGCNFMTTIKETIKVIKHLNCDYIKLHIDTGNIFMEEEDTEDIVDSLKYLESFHISDKNLGQIQNKKHAYVSDILEFINYNKYITLETIDDNLEDNLKKIFSFYNFKPKKCCLVGYTGFVGSNLKEQMMFTDYYNSKNIKNIHNKEYDEIYCCGVPGFKWLANKNPEKDMKSITDLLMDLSKVKCKKFILISTIDVYHNKNNTSENTQIEISKLDTYGAHRYFFEQEMSKLFNCYIYRLGGLFGKNLKKNIIYDLLYQNRVNFINPNNYFQWYNLDNLLSDIKIYDEQKITNLFSEPVKAESICNLFGYNKNIYNNISKQVHYNIKSEYYEMETEKQILLQIEKFIQSYNRIYNVYLINTPEIPIPWTHELCCKKFLKGFMYNGCRIFIVKDFNNLINKIKDKDNNIFIYSNHYGLDAYKKTYNTAMKHFKLISEKYQKTYHICWYLNELKINDKFPFKNYIMTGEKNSWSVKSTENKYLPMAFGIDLNPFEELEWNNDISNCKYNSCFIGTAYKYDWTTNLEKCLYFTHQRTGRFCVGKEKEQFMRNSIIGLGFNHDNNVKNGVVTDRIYESLAFCKVCLTDSPQAVKDTNGIAVLVKTKEELKKQIDYYLNNEEERNEKNRLGKELLKTTGTYYHTSKEYIDFIIELKNVL